MKRPLLGKALAIGGVGLVLLAGLSAIGGLVGERQGRQSEAEQSVAASLARAQTVIGPVLLRDCVETWVRWDLDGRERKRIEERREFVQRVFPQRLDISAQATLEPRYRGLFKVNGYASTSTLDAVYADLPMPAPSADRAEARVACAAPRIGLGLGDTRGVRAASARVDGIEQPVRPGSTLPGTPQGLHVALAEPAPPVVAARPVVDPGADPQTPVPTAAPRAAKPLKLSIALTLVGTGSLAWVPVGDQTSVQLRSDWRHPSFIGQFLATSRSIGQQGFAAQWQVGALASTAQQWVSHAQGLCPAGAGVASHAGVDDDLPVDDVRGRWREPGTAAAASPMGCVESFGVQFIDPVNGYVLSDRALKYGLLFIALTFAGVALVEVVRQLRVHPMQYGLVGAALTVFFLLLLSLSEQLPFGLAYAIAATACTLLLGYYGRHVLGSRRAGLAFGGAVGLLYGVLYVLLQRESGALMLGSLLLFAALSAVMVVTRRVDWYALSEAWREARPARAPVTPPGATPASAGAS